MGRRKHGDATAPEFGRQRTISNRYRMTFRARRLDRPVLAFRVEIGDLGLHVVAGADVSIVGNADSGTVEERRVGLAGGNRRLLFDQPAAGIEDV